jgi:hypothetical protein
MLELAEKVGRKVFGGKKMFGETDIGFVCVHEYTWHKRYRHVSLPVEATGLLE